MYQHWSPFIGVFWRRSATFELYFMFLQHFADPTASVRSVFGGSYMATSMAGWPRTAMHCLFSVYATRRVPCTTSSRLRHRRNDRWLRFDRDNHYTKCCILVLDCRTLVLGTMRQPRGKRFVSSVTQWFAEKAVIYR